MAVSSRATARGHQITQPHDITLGDDPLDMKMQNQVLEQLDVYNPFLCGSPL